MFPLETDLLKVSFLSTSSAHHIHSFAVLYLLVSAFPTSVASVLWEWKLLTLSTGFRNSFHGPYHSSGCLHLHQTLWISYPSYFWWIFHTGHNSPLHSLAFCLDDAVRTTSNLAISITQFSVTVCPSFTILALILSLASPLMIVSLST